MKLVTVTVPILGAFSAAALLKFCSTSSPLGMIGPTSTGNSTQGSQPFFIAVELNIEKILSSYKYKKFSLGIFYSVKPKDSSSVITTGESPDTPLVSWP